MFAIATFEPYSNTEAALEDQNTMTETLRARCTPELKRRLELVTLRRPGDVSDHIRFAIEQYVIAEEAKQLELASPIQTNQ